MSGAGRDERSLQALCEFVERQVQARQAYEPLRLYTPGDVVAVHFRLAKPGGKAVSWLCD